MSEKEERPGVGPDVLREEAKGATLWRELRSMGAACVGGGRGKAPGRVLAAGGGGGPAGRVLDAY